MQSASSKPCVHVPREDIREGARRGDTHSPRTANTSHTSFRQLQADQVHSSVVDEAKASPNWSDEANVNTSDVHNWSDEATSSDVDEERSRLSPDAHSWSDEEGKLSVPSDEEPADLGEGRGDDSEEGDDDEGDEEGDEGDDSDGESIIRSLDMKRDEENWVRKMCKKLLILKVRKSLAQTWKSVTGTRFFIYCTCLGDERHRLFAGGGDFAARV